MPEVGVRRARPDEVGLVSDILNEAAHWLGSIGQPLWRDEEITPERVAADASRGDYHIAWAGGESAGVVRFDLEDADCWGDITRGESCFVHRLAVRRRYAGRGVSHAMLTWAVERTRERGRRWLRLDTDAARPRVRAVYERFGFRHHSDGTVGPHVVARYEYDCSAT